MNPKYPVAAGVVVLAVALTACDRDKGKTATGAPTLPAQAERAVERAGAAIDDATVTAKVKTALIVDPGTKGFAIDVDTAQNIVTLSGAVQTQDARAQAERVARGIEGVKDVKNNLTVSATQGAVIVATSPDYTPSMEALQKGAQRLRESIQAMAQEPAGPKRNQAIKEARQALHDTNQAMIQLPPELRTEPKPPAGPMASSTSSTSSTGGTGSTGSQPDYSRSMEQLQKSAQQLREAIQAMAQQPSGTRRDQAIKEAHQALYDINQAMIQLPPEMRTEK